MKVQECRKKGIYNIGFIDPHVVKEESVRKWPNRTKNIIFTAMDRQHACTFILLPYNFDFHWILISIEIDRSRVVVFDSLRRPKEDYQSLIDILQSAWARFIHNHIGVATPPSDLYIKTDFPCFRQKQETNLCSYYVCEHIQDFCSSTKRMTQQQFDIWCMKEDLIKPERIRAIQESLCGFLLDEVINRKGEFYSDQRISVGRLDRNNRGGDNNDDDY
ncbi:uncharacterized protein LOC120639184 isoform X2 [Panicum virgatum]|nr:uncharacterized protein LOC120639184 isoform X2 [Panicum virgatum]